MAERKLGKRCPHSNNCEIYSSEKQVDNMPHFLYRNVFCERGEKGWNNCSQYAIFENPNQITSTETE